MANQATAGQNLAHAMRIGPRRSERLLICLSTEERAQVEAQARAGGFDSLAAYVRARTVGASPGEPRPTA